jgi:predicted glycosyltransferase
MLSNRLYYQFKPYLPSSLRMAVRRYIARRKRVVSAEQWPIRESAARLPEGWGGWPGGKKFAIVLTHDVEGPRGLVHCERLAEVEAARGFTSSFNFIPHGNYRVTREVRESLQQRGFEVGVHDLFHDGKLFHSEARFSEHAAEINRYLKEWNAVGFRSGFMLRNLDWIQCLNIRYDTSTFDTDPFEPQPDGVDTIFPYWVCGDASRSGYVELPYTLAQDSTLFLVLREKSNDIWKKKLDWIVSHGGMALINVHPDYIGFNGDGFTNTTYPVSMYTQFLDYVKHQYAGQYWNALPRDIAELVQKRRSSAARQPSFVTALSAAHKPKRKIWIDLDNTPHVPFFEPILAELRARGFEVFVTARDAFQVCDLADKKGLKYVKVGKHHGKNPLMKIVGLVYRALQLAPVVARARPILGVSHGSRSQLLLNNWTCRPTILIEDYEHCQFPPMMRPTWIMAPDVIPDENLPCKRENLRKYSGIKEDVYAWTLKEEPNFLQKLGINESDLVITVRPPATEAHYHNPESERLFERFMQRACDTPCARVVLLPRNQKQGAFIRATWPAWFENNKTVIPKQAVDGLNLIWHSDLVVSGGGTMNREAAALDVPVYSIFRGAIGAVDRQLSKQNRLILIESLEDVDTKIRLVKRTRRDVSEVTSQRTLTEIVDNIEAIAETLTRK